MSNLISKLLININCQAGQQLSDVQLSKFVDFIIGMAIGEVGESTRASFNFSVAQSNYEEKKNRRSAVVAAAATRRPNKLANYLQFIYAYNLQAGDY